MVETIDCLCGSRMPRHHLSKHLNGHTKEELASMLAVWLEAEANLDEAFSGSRSP